MYPLPEVNKSRKKATVVVVDDEQAILKELKILLGRLYKVHVFTNPEEVEVFVDENEVDLVISDEMMPEMRGSVLLAKINKKYPDICNIVLSGQAEKDDIVRAVNEGHIFSFLYKPTERQQLLNVIAKGLENREMKIRLAEQNAQLKEYSENLEKMVEEKTAQLVKAYERLNLLDANKMNFLVYLSEEMDSSLDRIQNLAQELITYFAFAGSEIDIDLFPVSFNQVTEDVIQRTRKRFEEAGIALDINLGPAVQVMANKEYLTQVINVLVENAFDFSSRGDKVNITGGEIDGKIRLCISDTGKGIPRENLRKIFMPFVISREERSPNGFGLNLPKAKSIINAMDGKIWVESDGHGKGAMFCMQLNRTV